MSKIRDRAANILDDIIKEIAKEEGLTFKKTNAVLHSAFEQIASDIRSGTLKGTRIIYLGKFVVKPYNIDRYLNKESQNGDNTENEGQCLQGV